MGAGSFQSVLVAVEKNLVLRTTCPSEKNLVLHRLRIESPAQNQVEPSHSAGSGGVFANMEPAKQEKVNTSAGILNPQSVQDQVLLRRASRAQDQVLLNGYQDRLETTSSGYRDRVDTTSSTESRNVFFQDSSFCAPSCKA